MAARARGGGRGGRRPRAAAAVPAPAIAPAAELEPAAIAEPLHGQLVPRVPALEQLPPELRAEVERRLGTFGAPQAQVVVIVVQQAAPAATELVLPPELREGVREFRNCFSRIESMWRVVDEISAELKESRRERGIAVSQWDSAEQKKDHLARRNVDEDPEVMARARWLKQRWGQ